MNYNYFTLSGRLHYDHEPLKKKEKERKWLVPQDPNTQSASIWLISVFFDLNTDLVHATKFGFQLTSLGLKCCLRKQSDSLAFNRMRSVLHNTVITPAMPSFKRTTIIKNKRKRGAGMPACLLLLVIQTLWRLLREI